MALTRNGMRIGMARHNELMREREMILDAQLDYWKYQMTDARDELKALDPAGWEAWWDSDAMPDVCSYKMRTEIIRARIAELLSGGGRELLSISHSMPQGVA
jgi:hypothetical protein